MGRKTIIAGNWKMHKTTGEAVELAQALESGLKGELAPVADHLPQIVICPTFVSLGEVAKTLQSGRIALGAQNMDHRDSGAYTGEISAPMLTAIKASHVIIGHSERRQYFGETDQSVNLKVKAALTHKLVPIVCVGETLEQREANQTDDVVTAQVKGGLADLDANAISSIVIAYEPVWAIGTGKNCDAHEANRVCGVIRKVFGDLFGKAAAESLSVLYGGSVKASTIEEQMQQADIDGALVGGAALKAEEFLPIIKGGAGRVKAASLAKA